MLFFKTSISLSSFFFVLLLRLGIGLELEVKLELVHMENKPNELKPSFFFLNQAKLEPDFKLVQKLGLGLELPHKLTSLARNVQSSARLGSLPALAVENM